MEKSMHVYKELDAVTIVGFGLSLSVTDDKATVEYNGMTATFEDALRDGKLAHVIHQYREAARAASEKQLASFARREADYYALLNDDDDYLAVELRRISWLQHSLRVRRLAALVTNASILVALIGPYFDASIAGICWSLASSSLVAWISSLFVIKILGTRRGPRLERSGFDL